MSLITVKQYAKQHGVSEQSVYGKIKRGTIDTTLIKGVAMIETAPSTTNATPETTNTTQAQLLIKLQKQLVKQQRREIKSRDKQIEDLRRQNAVLQERYYALTVLLQTDRASQLNYEAPIEVKIKKKKQKKKSDKKRHKK